MKKLIYISLFAILSACEPTTGLTEQQVVQIAERVTDAKINELNKEIQTLQYISRAQDSLIQKLTAFDSLLYARDQATLTYVYNSLVQMHQLYEDSEGGAIGPDVDTAYLSAYANGKRYTIKIVREE